MSIEREISAIKLLQDRSDFIEASHKEISSDVEVLKRELSSMEGVTEIQQGDEYVSAKRDILDSMTSTDPLECSVLEDIYDEAEARHPEPINLSDILSIEDFADAEKIVGIHIHNFNAKYNLDGWDYAIACSCGLFAAMLDLLCVKAPLKPTVAIDTPVNGIFNQWVQQAFNKLLPPDFDKILSAAFPIGAPDSSTTSDLKNAPDKALNPMNHRLRSLAHDPVLGFIIGVLDMKRGTCTTVVNGKIVVIQSTKDPINGNIFYLIGRMLGHLISDINAPSPNQNRGMGLPAPFMGLLRMFENIPVGCSNFGHQIEWMYINGYDFRQFIVSSIPMMMMEVLLRAFYVGKQVKLYSAPFGDTMLDTLPMKLNPRFRIMLALAYGTSSAVNAGKMYITHNILNANYASWMGLAWHGFHALKWALFDKHLALWSYVEEREIGELEQTVQNICKLSLRAVRLPTS
jgi:hypothetical protein